MSEQDEQHRGAAQNVEPGEARGPIARRGRVMRSLTLHWKNIGRNRPALKWAQGPYGLRTSAASAAREHTGSFKVWRFLSESTKNRLVGDGSERDANSSATRCL